MRTQATTLCLCAWIATACAPDDASGGPAGVPAGAVVLDHVTAVDALSVEADVAIVLDGASVAAVLPSGGPWPADADVRDLRGAFVVPGLIDSHTHLFHSGALDPVGPTLDDNLAAMLAWGVVGAADLGAPEAAFALRDEIARGERLGPRLWVTGPMVTTPGSHPCETHYDPHLCLFVDDRAGQVAAALAEADGLKVALADAAFTPWPTPRVDLDDLVALVDAAATQGQPVVAHTDTPQDAWDAWDAGVAVLAHPVFSEAADALPALPVTSTLAAFDGPVALEEGRLLAEDLTWTPEAVVDDWEAAQGRLDRHLPGWVAASADWHDAARANLAGRIARGETVLPGTDAGYWLVPHGVSLHAELEALVELGMSPRDALAAATLDAATTWGWLDQGLIEEGQRASLLVLSADPTADIRATRAIREVWLDGARVAAAAALEPADGDGAVCADADDCASDGACDALAHTCVPACDEAFAADNDCGPGAACLPGDGMPGGEPACRALRTCDAYAQDCAPDRYDEACVPLDLDTSACLPAGAAGVGEDCGWDRPEDGCQPGLFCSYVTATCFELCDPAAADTCSAGACTQQYVGRSPWFGLCL